MAVMGAGLAVASAESTYIYYNTPVTLVNGSSWFLEGTGGSTLLATQKVRTFFTSYSSESGGFASSWRNATFHPNGLLPMALQASTGGAAIPLNVGDIVGGGGTLAWQFGNVQWNSLVGGPLFISDNSGYFGFEFHNSSTGQMNYGWAHVNIYAWATGLEIDEWAYDTSGAPVTVGAVSPVPEPSSLALTGLGALIAGAAGMRKYHRRTPPKTATKES